MVTDKETLLKTVKQVGMEIYEEVEGIYEAGKRVIEEKSFHELDKMILDHGKYQLETILRSLYILDTKYGHNFDDMDHESFIELLGSVNMALIAYEVNYYDSGVK